MKYTQFHIHVDIVGIHNKLYMYEFLSVRQFAQSSATRHLQTLPSIHFWRSSRIHKRYGSSTTIIPFHMKIHRNIKISTLFKVVQTDGSDNEHRHLVHQWK